MAQLSLVGLSKVFLTTRAVDDFSLEVADGELICLLGPSGSGKSTVLRMIGGFETPSGGQILIDGDPVGGQPPERRPTSMVFQSHALWSHMTVFGNIAFGLRLRRLSRAQIRERVEETLDLVGLNGLGGRRTDHLSGGQQQRVALARSLVLQPKILLLDEPFASLDQHLRERLREEVRDIQQRLKITALFVTHGQDEALALADRIVVMNEGRIEQVDRPDKLYREPQTPFVASFVGTMNMIPGEVRSGRFQHTWLDVGAPIPDGPAILAVRPEAMGLEPSQRADAALVHRAVDFGTHSMVDVTINGDQRIKAMVGPDEYVADGQRVALFPHRYIVFRDGEVAFRSASAADVGRPALGAVAAN